MKLNQESGENMNHIRGDIKKIDLGMSSFERTITGNNLYVDKSAFIEHFLTEPNSVQLIVRQRRLGKTMNLDMLHYFLTDLQDYRYLFKDLYIENTKVWTFVNSTPVFIFDFKNLSVENYKLQIHKQIDKHIHTYVDMECLNGYFKRAYEEFLANKETYTEGIFLLTELVYEITGKRSYILIDEYDKLLTDYYNHDTYEEIKLFETQLLGAGLKSNNYLEKALLTGVMRVSRESILSGLNNLQTYDLFTDDLYTNDFGLTDEEIQELQSKEAFDLKEIKEWYNGIKISGTAIYNIYSVLSYIKSKRFDNYWGRSGTIDIIISLLNSDRREAIAKLLNGEIVQATVNRRISIQDLANDPDDSVFYSLLVQSGYLSVEEADINNWCSIRIPNKELMNVWKEFILTSVVKNSMKVRTLFENIDIPSLFDRDIEYFLSDRLSYFDLDFNQLERTYHLFILGLLSAYENIHYEKPLSNREGGDGRYDILFETADFYIIFEFKSVSDIKEAEEAAILALKQIDEKRYFAELNRNKKLIKTAIVFCGKQCVSKSKIHVWE